MKEVTKKDLFKFIGDKVKYDEFGGGYIWGEHKNGSVEMIAQVDEPTPEDDYVLSIRGWGAIQNLCKTDNTYAERFQDFMGQFIADAINEKMEREKDHYGEIMSNN
jgi:hypothetical protein